MAAQSAVDMARWDIKGKALGQPGYMLLGGKMRDRVVCYKGVGGKTDEVAAETAKKRVSEGWRYLRLGVTDRDGVLEPPVAVRDAAPGDAIRSDILSVEPDAWGYARVSPMALVIDQQLDDLAVDQFA